MIQPPPAFEDLLSAADTLTIFLLSGVTIIITGLAVVMIQLRKMNRTLKALVGVLSRSADPGVPYKGRFK
jgi:hypothetical protein